MFIRFFVHYEHQLSIPVYWAISVGGTTSARAEKTLTGLVNRLVNIFKAQLKKKKFKSRVSCPAFPFDFTFETYGLVDMKIHEFIVFQTFLLEIGFSTTRTKLYIIGVFRLFQLEGQAPIFFGDSSRPMLFTSSHEFCIYFLKKIKCNNCSFNFFFFLS